MKIRDYLKVDPEREAKLKAIATFSPETSLRKTRQAERLSPFDKAVIESIRPVTDGVSEPTIPYPMTTMIPISQTCDHSCSGCPFGGGLKEEDAFLHSNNFLKLLNSLRSLKVRFIHLSGGGEPTLHPEFCEFTETCTREKVNLSLLTNATALDQKAVELLVESFSFLRVKLDASNDQVYNRIHNPPHREEFQKVLVNLERLVARREVSKSNLTIGAEVRLCQANMNFTEEMVCLARDLGLDYIQFRINQGASDRLLPDQIQGVNRLIEQLKKSYRPFRVFGQVKSRKPSHGCGLSPVFLVITPSGDVYSCPHYYLHPQPTPLGNIFTQSTEEVWFGAEHRRTVESLRKEGCRVKDCRWRHYGDVARFSPRE